MNANPTTARTQVSIHLGDRSYPIVIGSELLSDPSSYQRLPRANTALIVSNSTVAPLYAEQLKRALTVQFPRVLMVTLPDGEAHKEIGRAHV